MRQPALDEEQTKALKEAVADAAKLAKRLRSKSTKDHLADVDTLLDDLRQATKLYTESGDQGRAGVLLALRAIQTFLLVLNIDRREDFTAPIAGLITALGDIERGVKNPLFIPSREPSRSATASWYRVRALAAFASDVLAKMGGDKAVGLADEAAVQVLTKLGLHKKRWNYGDQVDQGKGDDGHAADITARTIREWRAEIRRDTDCKHRETQLFYMLKEEWSRFPDRQRTRAHLVELLEMTARRLRPTA